MTKSFKIDEETLNQIKNDYKEYEVSEENDTFLFKAKTSSFSIQIYKNMTCLFQGSDVSEADKYMLPDKEEMMEHAGSDEVGCGDYFGPVVVCATIVKKEDYEFLYALGVRDSKMLTDEKIKEIAPKIKERVKYAVFVLSDRKYNEIHGKMNLNKIKAQLHNFVLYKVISKNNFKGKIIVDQFCDERLYYQYLNDYKGEGIVRNIYFTPKAENQFLAVACGSIIARFTFLEEIAKMEKEMGYKIILGASDKVDELAARIVKEKGFDFLSDYVKVHYKNTEKIKELI